MPRKILTASAISKLKPDPAKRLEIPDAACPGLYLVMQPTGARSWALRHRQGGRPQKLTLGNFSEGAEEGQGSPPVIGGRLTLADARRLAGDALGAIERGQSPAHAKRSRDKNLMPAVVDEFIKRYVRAKRLRSADAVERTFKVDVLPHWRHRHVSDISRRDVIELLDAHVDRGAPVQANRTLSAVRKFFNWCMERDIIKVSPVEGVKAPTPERNRDRILSDDEIVAFWQASDANGSPFGPLFRLLLLTGQRLGEVAGMAKAELDLDVGNWTIPAVRAKNNQEHVVALSQPARDVLADVRIVEGKAGLIFSTNGRTPVSGFGKAKANLDRKLSIPHWTLHDLRRTAASGMARLAQPVHVVEAVLNHRSGSVSGVAAVYNRYDYDREKRIALDAWAAYVLSLLRPADNVLRIDVRR